jgi:hypothetical protein
MVMATGEACATRDPAQARSVKQRARNGHGGRDMVRSLEAINGSLGTD